MWLLLACLATVLAAVWQWRVRRLVALNARVGSGLPTLPVLGQAHLFFTTDNQKIMNSIFALTEDALSRGGMSSHWLFDRLLLNIADPMAAAVVLRTCNEKGDSVRLLRELFDDCSLFAKVDVWRVRKKQFVSPMLTPKNVNALFDTFVKHAGVMLDQLQQRGLRGGRGVVCEFERFMANSLDNASEIMNSIFALTEDALSRGGMSSHWLFDRLLLNIADPMAAAVVLRTCNEKGDSVRLLRELFDDCSLFAKVDVWRVRKKQFVSPMLTPKNVNALFDTFVKHAGVMLDQLQQRGLRGGRGVVCEFERFMANSLDNASVDVWRVRKKQFVSPMLTPKNVNALFDTFVKHAGVMLDQLQQRGLRGGRGVVCAFERFMANSLDNASEATFGVSYNSQLESHCQMVEAIDNMTRCAGISMLNFWLLNGGLYTRIPLFKTYKKSEDIFLGNISQSVQKKQDEWQQAETSETTQCLDGSSGGPIYLLDLMKRAGVRDSKVLCEEAVGLWIAGSDTVALTGSFAALMLAAHPRVQNALYQELMEVFGDSDRVVTLADLPRMKYLEAVIKETTRLFPAGPLIYREAHADLQLPNGLTVPKGCFIAINIYGVNRNPKYWGEDASEFRPERFMQRLQHPEAYLAFSHGPRACAGYIYAMNLLKVNLSTLLRRYRLLPAPEAPAQPRMLYHITLKPGNTDVLLEPRANTASE